MSITPITCPMCGQVITDDDLLLVKWYQPRSWWVTYHYKRAEIGGRSDLTNHDGVWKSYCGRADIQSVVPRVAMVTNG